MKTPRFKITSERESATMLKPELREVTRARSTGFTRWNLSPQTILIIISLIAVLTRIWYTLGQSITFDEFYEVELAKESLNTIAYRGDGFPPLYSLIMHVWQSFFGEKAGIASARALSIIFGVACCPATYYMARRAVDETTGLVAAGLVAILPIHMFYTSEARAYSLLLLITCLATNAALKAIHTRALNDWIVFACLAAAGMYTHYLFACFVGAVLLVGLIQGRDWWTVVSGAIALALTMPLVLLWSKPDFNLQTDWSYRMPFGLGELFFTYAAFVLGYTAGPSTRELHPMTFKDATFAIAPWGIIVGAAALTLLMIAKKRLPTNESTPLLISLLLAPAVTGMACMTFDVGYQVRYVVWSVIPAIIFVSYLVVQSVHHRAGRYATGALILVLMAAGFSRTALDRYRNEDLQTAAEFFNCDPALKRPVVVVSGYMVEPFKYYLDSSWTLTGIPMNFKFDERVQEFDEVLNANLLPNGVVWFVYTREFHEDPDGVLFERISEAADLELVKDLAGLKVYRATAKSSDS